jgi:hypothetical protein
MRFLLLIIVIVVCVYALWFRAEPDSEPGPGPELMDVNDTFISGPLTPYNKAQKFQQQDYNEALDKHRKAMDDQEKEDGGG